MMAQEVESMLQGDNQGLQRKRPLILSAESELEDNALSSEDNMRNAILKEEDKAENVGISLFLLRKRYQTKRKSSGGNEQSGGIHTQSECSCSRNPEADPSKIR